MADGDVILQIPNAFIEFNAGENETLYPIVDVDNSGRAGEVHPPNFSSGNPARINTRGILNKQAQLFIDVVEQTITDPSPDDSYLEFTADLTGLGLGEYLYVIAENPAGDSFVKRDVQLWWPAHGQGVNAAQSEVVRTADAAIQPNPRETVTRAVNTGAGDIEFTTTQVWGNTAISLEATPDAGALQYPIIAKTGPDFTDGQLNFAGGMTFFMRYYRVGTYTGASNSGYKCICYCSSGNETHDVLWALIFQEGDFYLTLRYFTAAGAATWTDYATTLAIPADQWSTLLMQFDAATNRLFLGVNGTQQALAFTPSDVLTPTYFYWGGPWGTYSDLDENSFWDAFYSETVLIANKVVFGDRPTYTEPTKAFIAGVWYFKGASYYSGASGRFAASVGNPDDIFVVQMVGSGLAASYNGTAWASETSISGTLTWSGTWAAGSAGTPTDNIQFGSWGLGTASWNGTAWTAEGNHTVTRDDSGGAGSQAYGSDASAFVTGTTAGLQNTRVEYFTGSAWASGASTDTDSNSSACGGSFDERGALAINDSTSCSEYNGSTWSAIADPQPVMRTSSSGFGRDVNQFLAVTADTTATGFTPSQYNGVTWVTKEEMPAGGYNIRGVGAGGDSECCLPQAMTGLYDFQYMMGYNPVYADGKDIQGWWPKDA